MRGSRSAQLLSILVAGIAAVAVGEVALRALWHNPYRLEQPDEILKIWIQHHNTDHVVDRSHLLPDDPSVLFRSDEHGYILPSLQYEDPEVTIAFLGGSTTACPGVREDLRFPALVSTLLAERGFRVNTLNAARAAGTVHDSLNVLLNHVVRDHPDIVVLMNAATDVGLLNGAAGYSPRMGRVVSTGDLATWSLQMVSSRSYLAALLRHALTRGDGRSPKGLSKRNDPEFADRLPVDEFAERLRAYVGVARAFDIEPVLLTEPLAGTESDLSVPWASLGSQDRFNAKVREIGAEEGAKVIDLAHYLASEVPDWESPGRFFYDGMHVTDDGSRIEARYLVRNLLPDVESIRSARADSATRAP